MKYFKVLNLKGYDLFLNVKEHLIANQNVQFIKLVDDFDVVYLHFFYENEEFIMHFNIEQEVEFYMKDHVNNEIEVKALQRLQEFVLEPFKLSALLTM